MGIPFSQVDAFTSEPFHGNPAAVFVLDKPRDEDWMQAIAREMNLSETAFVWPEDDAYRLRWFTPSVEINLCGHATLATSHALWAAHLVALTEPIAFDTLSGRLTAERKGDWIELDFPARPEKSCAPPEGLIQGLGLKPLYVGDNGFDLIALVESEEVVRSLKPYVKRLSALSYEGVIVTAESSAPEYDFVSRFFAPALGIDEDPVTGAAHCCLAPFWKERLGKDELVGFQASVRGGTVKVRPEGDRVFLGGQAVTVLKGEVLA